MEDKDIYAEINSIRNLMERSTKFISLSGLSGIMAGIYALAGAAAAVQVIHNEKGRLYRDFSLDMAIQLFLIAFVVLILSIVTGIWLTIRKAKRCGQTVWNQSSKVLLINGLVPLLSGGAFVLVLLYKGDYHVIASACLIFYGLALAAASQHTYGDVKWLGMCEIILGLLALLKPGYGLMLWATGFGLLHIIYGSVMYFKYDRENSAK